MQNVVSALQLSKRILIVTACAVIATWGDLMAAAQLPERRDSRAEAIAALAEVGGVLRYDNQGRPVWLGFRQAEGEVDDTALANVAKLDTLEEINFMPLDLPIPGHGLRPLPEHRLVTDKGLVHLRGLPRLRALNLSNTGVRGPGLAQLHGNKLLTSLRFLGLPLGDEELKSVAGFDSLALLVLVNDKYDVTGEGLAHLAGLANLRSLYLGCRSISPEGLAHLSRMTYLNALDLDIPALDHIEFLRGLTRLTRLSLIHTAITDADLADIAGLKQLEVLTVRSAQIGDEGLRHLAGLSNLFALELSGTRITDAGVDQLPSLSGCWLLDMQRTAVTRAGEARLRAKYPAMSILR